MAAVRDRHFKPNLAYLADIFEALNTLNLKLQGPQTTILEHSDAIKTFIDKLTLWERKVGRGEKILAFKRLVEIDLTDEDQLREDIKSHMSSLKDELLKYFPDLDDNIQISLARNPFRCAVDDLPDEIQEEFLELRNNTAAKEEYQLLGISDFWAKMLPIFPQNSEFALKVLLPFSSTYLCERGFSSLLVTKSKYRNRLMVEGDLRCALTCHTSPRISELTSKKQTQPSH